MTSGDLRVGLKLLAELSGERGIIVISGESVLVELRGYPSTQLLATDTTLQGALRCALQPHADNDEGANRVQLRMLGVVP